MMSFIISPILSGESFFPFNFWRFIYESWISNSFLVPSTPFQICSLYSLVYLLHTYMNMFINITYWSFSVAETCLALTSWDWLNYQGLIPGKDWCSLSQQQLIAVAPLGKKHCEISHFTLAWQLVLACLRSYLGNHIVQIP